MSKSAVLLLIGFVFGAPVTWGCQLGDTAARDTGDLEGELQSLLEEMVRVNPAIPGALLHVEAPRLGLSWAGAAGVADRASGARLTPRHTVRLASNTKTFVAVSILRLWEEGRIDLDAPITAYLTAEYASLLESGGYDPGSITIRHLLTHTSGLFDYADSPPYGAAIGANTNRRWTRLEQVRGAMDWGQPYGAPGEVYRYSDTGYVLLGEILERLTGESLGAALRELIDYDRLGLSSTWLETVEPRPTGSADRAHQYIGGIDSYTWDPSMDLHGGGGLVSTVEDLARFIRAVFRGGVFARSSTSDTMLTTIVASRGGPAAYDTVQIPGVYRMGINVQELEGLTVYSHTGFWGNLAAYVPSLDAAFAVAVTQARAGNTRHEVFRRALTLVRAETSRRDLISGPRMR